MGGAPAARRSERVRHRRAARVRVLLRGVAPHGPRRASPVRATAASGCGPPRTPAAAARATPGWSPSRRRRRRRHRHGLRPHGLRLWVGFADGVVREHRVDIAGGGAGEGPSVVAARVQGPAGRADHLPTRRAHRPAAVCAHRRRPRRRRGRSFFAATHTFDCDGARANHAPSVAPALAAAARSGAEGAFAGSAASGPASAGRPLARSRSPRRPLDGRRRRGGSARLFDVDVGGVGVALPAAGPPGVRVNDVAWSPAALRGRLRRAARARSPRRARRAGARGGAPPRPAPAGASDSEADGAACRARAWRPP